MDDYGNGYWFCFFEGVAEENAHDKDGQNWPWFDVDDGEENGGNCYGEYAWKFWAKAIIDNAAEDQFFDNGDDNAADENKELQLEGTGKREDLVLQPLTRHGETEIFQNVCVEQIEQENTDKRSKAPGQEGSKFNWQAVETLFKVPAASEGNDYGYGKHYQV